MYTLRRGFFGAEALLELPSLDVHSTAANNELIELVTYIQYIAKNNLQSVFNSFCNNSRIWS